MSDSEQPSKWASESTKISNLDIQLTVKRYLILNFRVLASILQDLCQYSLILSQSKSVSKWVSDYMRKEVIYISHLLSKDASYQILRVLESIIMDSSQCPAILSQSNPVSKWTNE